jgi:hypothetical protein
VPEISSCELVRKGVLGRRLTFLKEDLWFIYTSIHKLITSSSRAGTDLILLPTDASQ